MNILGFNISRSINQKSEGNTPTQVKASEGSTVVTLNDLATRGFSNESMALKIEAVFACLRDKSESIGQIPLKLYKTESDGTRKQVRTGRNHRIFTQKPNDYMTMQQFNEMMSVSLERFGAFYAYIERNDRGSIMSLIPFRHQGNIQPNMDLNGNVYYTYLRNDGTQGDPYALNELFIVKGFTLDGYTPISPIVQTATNLNIADSQEKGYSELQDHGITSQMALSTDALFNDENARKRLKEDLKSIRGPNGAKEVAIFEQGLKPISLKLTPQETELLGNRAFTVNRICRTFRVPIHRVGIVSTSSKDNIVELDEAYMRDSLNPNLVKGETAFSEILPEGFSVEYDRNAFYSGSPWRLLAHVEKGVKGGLLTINEGRVILGWEPVEGGDVFAIDNNNVVYGFWNDLEAMQERIYGNNDNSSNKPKEGDNDE